MYKLRDWINIKDIDWDSISLNHNAIYLLENNLDKINWDNLSLNPNAIHILEQNNDKINWSYLSENKNAIQILEKNGMIKFEVGLVKTNRDKIKKRKSDDNRLPIGDDFILDA
jgi:hypothetical protein